MQEPPSNRSFSPLLALSAVMLVGVWAAAVYGTLHLHRFPAAGEWLGHGVCGPWGCAARPEALLGYHLFWLTLLAPAGGWLGARLEAGVAVTAGKAMLAGGLGLLAVMAGWAVIDCFLNGPEHLQQYWLQIAGFRLATSVEPPLAPAAEATALAGLACWLVGVTRSYRASKRSTPGSILPDPVEQSPAAAVGSPGTP